jgi:arylsulfatase A-like enzyme
MIGDGLLERLRIPLIFWSSRIGSLKKERALALDAVASHVDIIPTILWLLGGERAYSAVGRSLLDPRAPRAPGIASATCFSAYYLTDDFVLQYAPERGETRLFARRGGEVLQNDLAAERADVLATLREKLLAEYDIAKRLGMERRVWPARAESQ